MINKILSVAFIVLLAVIITEVGYFFVIKDKPLQASTNDSCSLSKMLYGRIQTDKKDKTNALLQPDIQAILGNIVKNSNSTYTYVQKTTGYVAKILKYDKDQYAMIDVVEKNGGKVILTSLVQVKDPHLYSTPDLSKLVPQSF